MLINHKQAKLYQYIQEFSKLAKFLNSCIIEHYALQKSIFSSDIDEIPIISSKKKLIPKESIIVCGDFTIKYAFHGIGCYFKIEEKVVNFNYYPKINDKVVFLFSVNELHEFICSCCDNVNLNIFQDKIELLAFLDELVALKYIQNIYQLPFKVYYWEERE